MDLDSLVEQTHRLLLDHLPLRASRTPSGWITFNCVMCSDLRRRAGIITSGAKISYHCFNCGFKTGWSPGPDLGKKYRQLALRMGANDDQIHRVIMLLLKHSDELEALEVTGHTLNINKFEPITLPDTVTAVEDLPDDHEIKLYAQKRGLLGLHPLLHFADPLNRRRLIVPFVFNGEVVGWTGRHVDPPADKSIPRYLGNTPQGFVFNMDRFVDSKRDIVIVTEGVFDAVQLDGVAVMHNKVSAEQAHLITQLGKRIIVCPDRNTAGKELIEQALMLDWEVSFPPWEDDIEDASDAVARYGRLATVESVIAHSTNNKVKIRVKSKIQ